MPKRLYAAAPYVHLHHDPRIVQYIGSCQSKYSLVLDLHRYAPLQIALADATAPGQGDCAIFGSGTTRPGRARSEVRGPPASQFTSLYLHELNDSTCRTSDAAASPRISMTPLEEPKLFAEYHRSWIGISQSSALEKSG